VTAGAGVRAAVSAAVAWALVLIVSGAAGGALDPFSDGLLVLVIGSNFMGAAVGTAAGAWQARAAGARAPGLGLLIPAVTVVVLGVLLTASGGGTTDSGDTGLIYAAFPLGAAVGAVVYGRRWLAGPR
jgi:hypothetical protein